MTKYLPKLPLFFTIGLLWLSLVGNAQWQFKENKGQWPSQVAYAAQVPNGQVYFEDNTFTFDFYLFEEGSKRYFGQERTQKASSSQPHNHPHGPHGPPPTGKFAYKLQFKGAQTPKISSESTALTGVSNYFLGNDPSRWASNVRAFPDLKYTNLYPGINVELRGVGNALKYDFICQPGSNPQQIRIAADGFERFTIKDGKAHYTHPKFNVVESIPITYQIIDGDTVKIACSFRQLNDGSIGFKIGSYDSTRALVIDPALIFSTYSGSFSDNFGFTATYDNEGFLYGGGNVYGNRYPVTTGAYDESYNSSSTAQFDVVITKFDTTGSSLVYSTYLGGSDKEQPHSMVVNEFGQLYVFGTTGSNDFPTTPGAYDRIFAGGPYTVFRYGEDFVGPRFENGLDIFVAMLSGEGDQLLNSTFLGGDENDGINGFKEETGPPYSFIPPTNYNYADEFRGEIDIDPQGRVYIASSTFSPDFPVTSDAFQSTFHPSNGNTNADGIITILNADLSALNYSTFFGGAGFDVLHSIAIKEDEFVVCGGSTSSQIAVPANKIGFQGSNGGDADGIIAGFDRGSKTLNHFNFLGTSEYDQTLFVEYDKEDFIYVLGQTQETGNYFDRGNPGYINPGAGIFVTKISADGQTRLLSSTVGDQNGTTGKGTPRISPTAFLIDNCQRIYISGWANNFGDVYPGFNVSGLELTEDPYGLTNSESEQYLSVFAPDMQQLVFATLIGDPSAGEHVDGGTSRFDKKGIVYQAICGSCGGSSSFPTTSDAFSRSNNSGNCNLTVFKYDLEPPIVTADFRIPDPGCQEFASYTFNNLSTPADIYRWTLPDGSVVEEFSPSYTFNGPGIYEVTLKAINPEACNLEDSITKSFTYVVGGNFEINDTVLCEGGSVNIGPDLDGLPVNNFEWDAHPDINDVNNRNPTVTPNSDAVYTARVTILDCEIVYNYRVSVEDFEPDAPSDISFCGDNNPAELYIPTEGVLKEYYWYNSNGDLISSDPERDSIFEVSVSGTETISYQVLSENCEYTGAILVNRISSPLPEDTTSCDGENIVLDVAQSIAGTQYIWSSDASFSNRLNDNNSDSDILVGPTESTTYYYRIVTDDCTLEDSITVAPFLVDQPSDTTICNGDAIALGYILPSFSGYTYRWLPDPQIPDPNSPNPTVSPEFNQAYQVEITSAGCSKIITLEVEVVRFDYTITPDTLICDPNTPIVLEISAAQQMNITWSDNIDFTNKLNTGNNRSIGVLPDHGSYTYYVRLERGFCEKIDSVTVYSHNPVIPDVTDLCDTNTTVTLLSDGLGQIETFQWSTTRNFSNTLNNNPQDSTIDVQVKTPTYFYIMTTATNCTYVDSILVRPFIVTLTEDTLVCDPNDPILLEAASTIPNSKYFWSETLDFTNTLNGPNEGSITVNPANQTERYYINVTVNGCDFLDSVDVIIHEPINTNQLNYCDTRDSLELVSDGLGLITQYRWSSDKNFSTLLNDNLQDSSATVNPTTNSWYYIETATPYCTYLDSIFVEPFLIEVSPDTFLCDTGLNLVFEASGGFENGDLATITWAENTSFTPPIPPSGPGRINVNSGSESTTYFVQLSARDCEVIDSARVLIHEPFDAEEVAICNPTSSITLVSDGLGNIDSYEWSSNRDFTDMLNDNTNDSDIVVNPDVSAWFYIRTQSEFCAFEDSVFVRRHIPGLVSDTLVCDPFTPIDLTVDGSGITTSFTWDTLPDFSSNPPFPTAGNDSTISVLPDETTTYYIRLESQNCTYIDSVTVIRYDTGLENDTALVCEGDDITVSVNSNAETLSFEWSNNLDFDPVLSNTPTFTRNSSQAGTYFVRIETANCFFIDSVNISPFVLPPLNDTTLCDGSTMQLGFDAEPFSGLIYSWAPSPDIPNPTEPYPTVTFGTQGTFTYTLNVRAPGLNCPKQLTQTITVKSIIDSITPDQLYCDPSTPITLGAYSLDPGNSIFEWSDDPNFTTLLNTNNNNEIDVQPTASTTYYVRVGNGVCNDVAEVTLEIAEPLPFNSFTICDPDQEVTLSPVVQNTVQNYIWSSNRNFTDTLNNFPDPELTILPQETTKYYLLRQGEFCDVIDSVEVLRYLTFLPEDTLLCNPTNPVVLNVPVAGSGSTFTWDTLPDFSSPIPLSTSGTLTENPTETTTYYVRVQDNATQCEYIDSISVLILDLDLPQVKQYICQQGASQRLEVNTDTLNTKIAWSTSPQFTPILSANNTYFARPDTLTTYYVRVRARGCEFVEQVAVSPFEIPSLPNEIICKGTNFTLGPQDPSLFLDATYNWDPDPYGFISPTDLNNTNPRITPDTTSTYVLNYEQGPCLATLNQRVVVDYVGPLIADASPFAVCKLNEPITLSAQTIAPVQSFEWSQNSTYTPLINKDDPLADTITYEPQNANETIYLRCTSANGCPFTDEIDLELVSTAASIIATDEFCVGDPIVLSISAASFNVAPQQVVWSPASIMSKNPPVGTSINAFPEDTVTVQANIIFNPSCQLQASKFIKPSPVYSYEPEIALDDPNVYLTQEFTLTNVNPSTQFSSFWDPTGLEGDPNLNSQSYVADNELDVIVLRTFDFMCTRNDTFRIARYYQDLICGPPNIFVPNAFSPNGDGENDILRVRGSFVDEMLFRVYDRWGQLIFESRDQEIGWDGTFKGKLLNPAVYVYYAEGTCSNQAPFYIQGNVTLLR